MDLRKAINSNKEIKTFLVLGTSLQYILTQEHEVFL